MAQEHSRVYQRDTEEKQYEVVRRIGAGAFAQVFLVRHRGLGRQCVMKEITSFTAMGAEKQEAAELEVRLLSGLQHPNIVGYFDSLIDKDGHLCIFMEYCEHGDVHTYFQCVKRAGEALPCEAQVLDWFVQTVLALQVLHAKRILHRDLKTQNIFLCGCGTSSGPPDFAVKLGDLGVAKALSSTAELAMTQIGTPFYMSPELFNNKPYGYKSDIWALGCVLYELINGQHAFEAQSINGLALKILKARYTPITSNCPEELQNLIRSMLSTNPAHRPSLQELMHVPTVQRRVPSALQATASAAEVSLGGEAKAMAEAVLGEQLASLGIGGFGTGGCAADSPSANQRRDKRQLQQRLERAERRKKREEETLRRLQETAAMLGQYLSAPRPPRSHGVTGDAEAFMAAAPASGYGGYGAYGGHSGHASYAGQGPPRAPPLALAPLEVATVQNSARTEPWAGEADEGAMSHRDKVLLRKEKRREEEQQRFEEEARKIREENLAYQRAWVMGSKDMSSSSRHSKEPPHSQQPFGQQAALGGAKQLPPNLSPLKPLLENKHITPANLVNPFQSCRQKVVHTPYRSDRVWGAEGFGGTSEVSPRPRPPPVHYNEPTPPQESHGGRRWVRAGGERQVRRTRSLRAVSLEALPIEPRLQPEHSEESDFSASSDGSDGRASGDDARLRLESQVVQQRIDECRAAIHRHKMTIDMLQNAAAAQDQEGLGPPGPTAADEGPPGARTARARPQAVPAIIQDRVARLRRRCIEGLGLERFEAARHCLQHLAGAGEARRSMLEILGQDYIGFHSLLDQILHMEQQWGQPEPSDPQAFRPGGAPAVRNVDESMYGGRWPSALSDVYSTAKSRMQSEPDFDW
eukprot:TRINITY_DN15529_c0_g1_i1.p1 TRINITY_DN15529_c0_g1~~TRINITY_DN15529_c0_g1_i1.p1  ORF type:complete len:863 (+),score=195.18 TRINITY_DN15529_c0_g1_i1:127-2715(+)